MVADLQRSVDYFSNRLGFECQLADVDKVWDPYIRVDDVAAICAEVQQRGAGVDYTIYNAPHGFREFGVQDPDGHDIAFGQRLAA